MDFRDNPNVEGIKDFLAINANFEVFERVLNFFGMVYMNFLKKKSPFPQGNPMMLKAMRSKFWIK
jgi:hypothetical protein